MAAFDSVSDNFKVFDIFRVSPTGGALFDATRTICRNQIVCDPVAVFVLGAFADQQDPYFRDFTISEFNSQALALVRLAQQLNVKCHAASRRDFSLR
jgi:hypothetical protein